MPVPATINVYHILHVDRIQSVIGSGGLLSDAVLSANQLPGTVIGMNSIKQRRLYELQLSNHPQLFVGQCVPFYFCPRSIMLYLIHCANHDELAYKGGQGPIIHLEGNLHEAVAWADAQNRRWAFTLSNAGARYFEDRCSLGDLGEIDWAAVTANHWSGVNVSRQVKEGKQAEFLIEQFFPWQLVKRIGVHSRAVAQQVSNILQHAQHRPTIEIRPDWYY